MNHPEYIHEETLTYSIELKDHEFTQDDIIYHFESISFDKEITDSEAYTYNDVEIKYLSFHNGAKLIKDLDRDWETINNIILSEFMVF